MDPNFNAEAFTLLGIGIGLIAFRFTSRLATLGIRNLRPDDYLMLLVAVLYAGHTVSAYYVGVFGKGLTNAAMTPREREALSHFPDSKEYTDRVGGSKAQILVWVVYSSLLWILKICMLFFYSRLTENVDKIRPRIQMGFVVLPATFIILVCVELFGCHPFQKHWQIYPDPGAVCYPSHSMPNLYTMIILNVTTDLYLMFIPLPMIWRSFLPTKVKVGLYVMFSGGVVVTTVAFLCCFFIITAGIEGAARAGQWSIRESFLAILITNIPLIFPFVARFYNRVSSTLSSSSGKRGSYRLNSSPGISFGSLGRKKAPSPYSIPGESAWEKTVWDRTVNGEQDWHSQDAMFVPNHKIDIETGSATCAERVAMEGSEKKDVVVVSTEVGITSDGGSLSRSSMLVNPKPALLAP